jgi:hypothetical protein
MIRNFNGIKKKNFLDKRAAAAARKLTQTVQGVASRGGGNVDGWDIESDGEDEVLPNRNPSPNPNARGRCARAANTCTSTSTHQQSAGSSAVETGVGGFFRRRFGSTSKSGPLLDF